MDLKQISSILNELEEDKGIPKERIIETIEMALAAAYKRDYGERGQVIHAHFNLDTGKVTFKQARTVVDESMIKTEEEVSAEEAAAKEAEAEAEAQQSAQAGKTSPTEKAETAERAKSKPANHKAIENKSDGRGETITSGASGAETPEDESEEAKKVRFNPERHIMIDEARGIKKSAKPGDELEFPLKAKDDYGRIAAQTAKQVIIQRIREAEREAVWNEFKEKEGEVISGIVQRIEGRNVFLDLGRTTAILPYEEQVPHERYRIGERIKALLMTTEHGTHGPGIYLSRSHPQFVVQLFALEVPEISQEAVEVKGIAREAGSRSKIAATSHEDGIDPVGSLVGQKGMRVSTVITELGGEKIDIIEWSENPETFIASALSPAKVLSVDTDDKTKGAVVIVDESQLSLAIGRGGQNVRLAAKLTGWRIDVRGQEDETGAEEETEEETAGAEEENEGETGEPAAEEKKEGEESAAEEKKEENEEAAATGADTPSDTNKTDEKTEKPSPS